MTMIMSLARLSDDRLLAETLRAAADERGATVRLVRLLGEMDERRLYLGQGCASLFTYCTQVLHLSEHAAYDRIEAARTARRVPLVLERLAEGALTLTAVGLLRPHLTADNARTLLDAARHKSKREVEQLVARLSPQPAAPASCRKLPGAVPAAVTAAHPPSAIEVPRASHAPAAGAASVTPTSSTPGRAVVQPLAPERFKLQLTISGETHAKLRQVQDLMRHQLPSGDLAAIVDRALTLLLDHLQRTKVAATAQPRPVARASRAGSRHIPAAVKREVWTRDGGRCAFVGAQGRCTETGLLEFHHVEPFACGGPSTSANLQLRCRSHNGHEAARHVGRDPLMARERAVGWGGELGLDESLDATSCRRPRGSPGRLGLLRLDSHRPRRAAALRLRDGAPALAGRGGTAHVLRDAENAPQIRVTENSGAFPLSSVTRPERGSVISMCRRAIRRG